MRVGRPIAGAIASHEGEADPHPVYDLGSEVDGKIATHKGDAYAHHSPPVEGARVYHSVAQSIPHNTWTVLAFDSQHYDTDNIHDPVTNNSRLTCKTAGKYVIWFFIRFLASATGVRGILIRLNGITSIGNQAYTSPASGDAQTALNISMTKDLVVNDYVEVVVFQNSGAALNVEYGWEIGFGMQRVG